MLFFMPVIIEFSGYIGAYSSAKFELIRFHDIIIKRLGAANYFHDVLCLESSERNGYKDE